MPESVFDKVMPLSEKHSEIFALKDDKMPTNNFYQLKLRVNDNSPVYTKNYRLSYSQRREIKDKVENAQIVREFIRKEPKSSLKYMESELGIFAASIYRILTENLEYIKVYSLL